MARWVISTLPSIRGHSSGSHRKPRPEVNSSLVILGVSCSFLDQFISKAKKEPLYQLLIEATKRADLGIEPRTSRIIPLESLTMRSSRIYPFPSVRPLIGIARASSCLLNIRG